MEWTPERIERLKKMKAQHLSASAIGCALNTSRNSVIGKARRLKLGGWESSRFSFKQAWPSPPSVKKEPKPVAVRPAGVIVTHEAPKPVVWRYDAPKTESKVIADEFMTPREKAQRLFELAWVNTTKLETAE